MANIWTLDPKNFRKRSVCWHSECLQVQLAFGALVGASAQAVPPHAPERRYALREVKARLHQASFRDAVLAAYGGRCAISHLPEPRLLDAAHMIVDADEQFGQPVISNGLPLTKIHHAAFDAHLIGIDADFRVHVSDRLLEIHDGPFLELGLKGIVGQAIQLPRRNEDRPDLERFYLAKADLIDTSRRGVWTLTVFPRIRGTRTEIENATEALVPRCVGHG